MLSVTQLGRLRTEQKPVLILKHLRLGFWDPKRQTESASRQQH
jgi:hypothetical protein